MDSAGIPRQGIYIKNSKRFIFTHTTPATTKPGRMVTQVEGLPLIKSHISLLMKKKEKLHLQFPKNCKHLTYHGDDLG